MAPPPDEGASYSSIDPAALAAAASALQKSVDGVNNNIAGLLSQFQRYGIATGNIDTLKRIAGKIGPVIPEINRRVSLARQLVAENPDGGKVAYFQGDLLGSFKTVAAAKAQAHIDAQKIQHAKDNDDSVPQSVYDDMSKYSTDPDYTSALVQEVGPKGVAFLMYKNRDTDDGDYSQPNSTIISQVLATASYRVPLNHDWYKDVADSLMHDGGISNPIGMLVKEMTFGGKYSTGAVSSLADITFSFSDQDGISANRTNDDYKNMLQILTDDPVTAAKYFHGRAQDIYDRFIKGNPDSSLTYGLDNQIAAFVQAATVDSKIDFDVQNPNGKPGSNLAAQNASWLVNQVGHDDFHDYSGAMNKEFAVIGSTYFDDFMNTLKSPLNVSATNAPWLGVNADPTTWKNFFAQGMKSDDGLAILSTQFSNNINELNSELNTSIERAHQSGNDNSPQQDPMRATAWTRYTRNELQSLFTGSLNVADDQIGKDYQDRVNAINDLVSKGLDLVSDPSGALGTVEGFAKDAIKSQLASVITGKLAGEEPALPGKQIKITNTVFDEAGDYATDANQQYNAGLGGKKPPFTPYHDGYGNTYTGDPKTYEKQYGGNFTDSSGHVLPLNKIAQDPKALEAYNQWLQDPAVQANVSGNDGRPN